MSRILMISAVLAATLFGPLAVRTPLAQSVGTAAPAARARVIVKYRADSPLLKKQAMTASGLRALQTQALGERIGVALAPGNSISERSHVVKASGIDSATLAARLAAQADIEYAVPDERKHIVAVPTDQFYANRAYNSTTSPTSGGPLVGQWYLKPPGPVLDALGVATNTAPSSINAEQAWDISTGSASVVVAVIDTGLRFDHPDLQGGNVLPGYDMISADDDPVNSIFVTANDGNGRDADASDPGDWVDAASAADTTSPLYQCTVENSSWHGTQTLGLIGAATNNGAGIASVGRAVKVMPVRALGRCGGYDSDIQAAMLWAAGIAVPGAPANANRARVLNMSLGGGGGCNTAYQDVVNQVVASGAVVVVSAGNSTGHLVGSPAACTGVIAVAGLRHVGDKVGFSDLGPEIALSAPGGNCINTTAGTPCLYPIMTTGNAGTTIPVAGAAGAIYTDSFNPSLGTSFSAPLVSGTAALMLSLKPSLTPAALKAVLQSTARAFPTTGGTVGISQCTAPTATSADQAECYCTTTVCGAGMLDAHAALLALTGVTGVQAAISVTTTTPTAGQAVVLTSSSTLGTGQSIASDSWAITSAGTTGATITAGASAATATVAPTAAGTFTISLTTVDNTGFVSTASSSVTVAAAVVTTPPSGSSGGGALDIQWLLLLFAAVLALAASNRAALRRGASLSGAARPSRKR